MSDTRQDRIRWLFNRAIDLPAAERGVFLDQNCSDDPELKRRMFAMLAATDDHFVHAKPSDAERLAESGQPEFAELREGPGSRIGPYVLLEQIGEGGFGAVFLAEQEHPVARRVALKIIKLGMDTRQVVARFEQERQALALMDHPNIARVLDAGDTTTGRPYFVMDFVQGEPIVDYCDKHNLTISARLEVFAQVCGAVQHAHAKGIIHRDIKPSNVLVGSEDGKPIAKVIDFGIAKATSQKLTDKTLITEQQQVMGTYQYMSPEQAAGSLDIDTRTDVYSLGVLLYELLTGSTPFDRRALQNAVYSEIHRLIREVEPPRPSTRIGESSERLAGIAARRCVEPKRLGTMIRGELDWIVMKALEKDRQRRYETAAGLARDIRRYLDGEDVAAAPPSAAYRLSKFARRNRAVVVSVAAVGAALFIGVVGFAWQAHRAQFERDLAREAQLAATQQSALAERNQHTAEAINQFLLDMLGAANIRKLGRDATVVQALDSAAANVDTSFSERPEVEASVRRILGATYLSLGLLDAAEPHIDEALKMRRNLHGEVSREHAQSLQDLGNLRSMRGQTESAASTFRDAAELAGQATGLDSSFTIAVRTDYANKLVELGRHAEAETMLREILAARMNSSGVESNDTLIAINSLAVLLHNMKRLDEAEPLYRQAAEVGARVLGPGHADTITARMNLASLLSSRGRYEEAEPLMKDSLADIRRVFGDAHPRTATAARVLGQFYSSRGRLQDALPLLEEAVAMGIRAEGESTADVAVSKQSLARLMKDLRNLPRAMELQRDVVAIYTALKGPESEDTLRSRLNLADMLVAARALPEAQAEFDDLLVVVPRSVGEVHALVVRVNNGYALLLKQLDRESETGPYLRRALEISRIVDGVDHPETLITQFNVMVHERINKRFDVAESAARELIPKFEKAFGPQHPYTGVARSGHAMALEGLGRIDEALAEFVAAVEITKRASGATNPAFGEHAQELGRLLVDAARAADAEPVLVEVIDVYRVSYGENDWRTAKVGLELGRCQQALQKFVAAEERLLASHTCLAQSAPTREKELAQARRYLAAFYQAWNTAEPDAARAAKAAEWQASLETAR